MLLRLILKLLLALGALACLKSTAGAANIWWRGEIGDAGTLDPAKAKIVAEGDVIDELYEGLVAFNAKGEIIPGMAKNWSIDPAGLVYRFELREDAKWSNGDPVVAQDFVFALRRLMAPETAAPYANILFTLKNAEEVEKGLLPLDALGAVALSDKKLELTLKQPTPYFIAQLAHLTAKPLHQASINLYHGDFVNPAHMVTNGPFMLQQFIPNDQIKLIKNPYYYDAANVALDEEIFVPIEDRSAALRRFMAGEILSYNDVPLEQIGFVRTHLAKEFKVSANLGTFYYAFDTRQKPFDDRRVRQALSMVIDREFLAEHIWGGTMEPGYSFVPPGIASYGQPSSVAWKDLNIFDREDAAKKLLRDAGYGEGGKKLDVEIRCMNSENYRTTAIAIADMWKVLGVETKILFTDANSHYAHLLEKAPYDVALALWWADYPDAQNFLFLAESGNKALNYTNFADPAFDALMDRAAQETLPAARSKLLHQAESLLLDEQPGLVLMIFRARNLVSQKLRGWEPNVLEAHPGRYISIAP